MDTMYQRGKIQEESMYYEHKKHDGSLPLVGVNTFLPKEHAGEVATEIELIRSTEGEKAQQIANVAGWQANRNRLAPEGETATGHIAGADESGSELAQAVHDGHGLGVSSGHGAQAGERLRGAGGSGQDPQPGQISHALYDVGGEYRRNM